MIALLTLLTQTVFAGATASTYKKDPRKGENYWNAGSAIDNNLETAWMVPGESENKGEWIMIDGPAGSSTLDKISLVNGYASSAENFSDYSRVKELLVEVWEYDSSGDLQLTTKTAKIQIEDKIERQTIDVPDLKIDSMRGGKFKVTITDIYSGADYPSVALTELLLHLGEFDGSAQIAGAEGTAEGSDELNLVDNNIKTMWLANEKSSFKLQGTISSIGILSNNANYAKPKKVKVSTGGQSREFELPNTTKMNWVVVPTVTGYTGSNWDDVTVEILEVYPGKNPQVSIVDVKTKITVPSSF